MKTRETLNAIKAYTKVNCPLLIPHLESVRRLALELATHHHLDHGKLEIASWGHDIFRTLPEIELTRLIKSHQNELMDPITIKTPRVLYHGPLAAILFPGLFHYNDPEVLRAIRYHSVISDDPHPIEAALFIADKLEPGKNRKNSKKLLCLAKNDLFNGLYELVVQIINHHKTQGYQVNPTFLLFIEKHKKK